MTDLLDEDALGAEIDRHYQGPGDLLVRVERLPLYAVSQQAAELRAWREHGKPDLAAMQPWLDVLAGEVERKMRTRRLRILSAHLTDDELRACHWGYPFVGRYEEIRVLRRGEHPVPDLLDHDYYLCRPASGGQVVIRMHYSDAGLFRGASIVPGDAHGPYNRELRVGWAIGEPFTKWWDRHNELHRPWAAVA
jgi:hypothetical protein